MTTTEQWEMTYCGKTVTLYMKWHSINSSQTNKLKMQAINCFEQQIKDRDTDYKSKEEIY